MKFKNKDSQIKKNCVDKPKKRHNYTKIEKKMMDNRVDRVDCNIGVTMRYLGNLIDNKAVLYYNIFINNIR